MPQLDLCLPQKTNWTKKLTHLANSLLRLMVAKVRASDNKKQADRGMVVVLQVTTNDFFWRT